MTIFLAPHNPWQMLPSGQSAVPDMVLQALALLLIAGFIIWLIFFSGNGDFKSFLEDLKGQPQEIKTDPFPVPVFDKSKVEVPRPPRVQRKPLTYQRTADELDLKLDNWAKDLRQSLHEVRAESQWLVEKYKDVPLKRPKPEGKATVSEKKPVKKSTRSTTGKPIKKTASTKSTKAKPKAATTAKTKGKPASTKKPKGKK